jgi:hypothetical protein
MAEPKDMDFIAFASSSSAGEDDIRDVTTPSDPYTTLPTKISAGYDHKAARAAYAAEKRRAESRSGYESAVIRPPWAMPLALLVKGPFVAVYE